MNTVLRKALPLLLCLIICVCLAPAAWAEETEEIILIEDYEPYPAADSSVTLSSELSDAEVFHAAGDPITVSFDGNGADSGSMEPQIFYAGVKQQLAVNTFTREGYFFTGWNTRADGSGSSAHDGSNLTFSENYSSDAVTFYAQWIKKVTVHLDPNGASGVRKGQVFKQGIAGKLVAMEKVGYTRDGYEFVGWAPVPDAAPDDPRIIPDGGAFTAEEETTLYAIWRRDLWWAVGFALDEDSNGAGMIRLMSGSTALTSNSNITDSNGNIIIKPNGTNAWLVNHDANTDLTLTVKASSGVTAYVRLNDGEYSSFTGERTFALGKVTGQMIYTVAFFGQLSPITDNLLILPNALTVIQDEAFAGGAFMGAMVPAQVTAIGSRAFADCPNLRNVYILGSTTEIAEDAFENVNGLTIIGKFQSAAIAFAKEYGYSYTITG